MAELSNNPSYIKHNIRDGIVEESYVEFEISQAIANSNTGVTAGTYSLIGADIYGSETYYESNKETLLQAFGSENCRDGETWYECNVPGVFAGAYDGGMIHAGNNYDCSINEYGEYICTSMG